MPAARTRQAAMLDGEGTIYIEQEELRDLKDGEVLVEVEASLISPGTEGGGVVSRRKNPDPGASPRTLGYQNAGRVVETGPGVEGYVPGDRVACMGSGFALHADFTYIPHNLSTPLPEGLRFEQGAFNHLAATGLQAVRRAKLQLGEYVAVCGLGLVGQLTGQLARIAGCRVIGFDLFPNRVQVALETGFDEAYCVENGDPVEVAREFTEGEGIDCGFISFGGDATEALKQLVGMAKVAPDGHQMGRVVIVGGARITQSFPVPMGNMDLRASSRTGPGYHDADYEYGEEYPPVFIQWPTRRNLREVVRLMDEGRLKVTPLITDRFQLEDTDRAYQRILESPEKALGVIIRPNGS